MVTKEQYENGERCKGICGILCNHSQGCYQYEEELRRREEIKKQIIIEVSEDDGGVEYNLIVPKNANMGIAVEIDGILKSYARVAETKFQLVYINTFVSFRDVPNTLSVKFDREFDYSMIDKALEKFKRGQDYLFVLEQN